MWSLERRYFSLHLRRVPDLCRLSFARPGTQALTSASVLVHALLFSARLAVYAACCTYECTPCMALIVSFNVLRDSCAIPAVEVMVSDVSAFMAACAVQVLRQLGLMADMDIDELENLAQRVEVAKHQVC